MLDSDTLPVNHVGNSDDLGRRGFPFWLVGMALPPLSLGGLALLLRPAQAPWAGALGGLVSVVYLAWVARGDERRLRRARTIQENIEDAWTAYSKGEFSRAEELLKSNTEEAAQHLGRFDLVTLACWHTLGNLYRLRADYASASAAYDQALAIYQILMPKAHPARGNFHRHRALNLAHLGSLPEALQEAHLSQLILHHCPGQALELAESLGLVGRLSLESGELEASAQAYSEALELLRQHLKPKDPQILTAMSNLCRVYLRQRRLQESEQFLEELLEQHRQQPDLSPEDHLETLVDLAWLRIEQGRGQDSEPLLLQALALIQNRVGPRERPLQRVQEAYRRLTQQGQAAAATTHGLINLILIFCGEREKLRQTLEHFPLWLNARDATGWGPLHWATFIGRDDIVRWLLGRGAETESSGDLVSPLHVAAAWGKRESLLELLEAGADLQSRDAQGWTPLYWACYSGQPRTVELLLKRGSEVNLRDNQGLSPLHLAAQGGFLQIVAALVAQGARVGAKDGNLARQPLHLAALKGHLAVCECLVYNQGDLNAKDQQGHSPLDLAQQRQHRLLVRVLQRLSRAGLGRGRSGGQRRMSLDGT